MRLHPLVLLLFLLIPNTVCADLRIQEQMHELYPQRLRLVSLPDVLAEAVLAIMAPLPMTSAAQPLLLPVRGVVSSPFGRRVQPLPGASAQHRGVDIAAPLGTRVHAVFSGIVSFVGMVPGCGLGVVIAHASSLVTRSCHLASVCVRAGNHVESGEVIGRVGVSGVTTGPHLHVELWKDRQAMDPAQWLYVFSW